MGFIAAAIVAAGATAYAAKSASDSSKRANKTNLDNATSDRDLQERMFMRGRGAEGFPVFSPYYSGSFEPDVLYPAARGAFEGAFPTGADARNRLLASYKSMQAGLRPAFDAGTKTVGDIFSGALTGERLGYAAPVAAARKAKGATSSAAIMAGLKERLAAINANRARAGYTGGGTATELPLLRSTIGARAAAADTTAQAELENQLMFQAIKDEGLGLRLNSLDLPMSRFNQAVQFENAPNQALVEQFMRAYQPLGIFNINPETFRPSPTPTVQPIPGIGSAIAAGGSVLGNSLANYYSNQQQQKLWQDALMRSALAYGAGSPATTATVNAGALPLYGSEGQWS